MPRAGGPQTVTKHGKPAVVIVDAARYERLEGLERAEAPTFGELLLEMPQDDQEFLARKRQDARHRALMRLLDTVTLLGASPQEADPALVAWIERQRPTEASTSVLLASAKSNAVSHVKPRSTPTLPLHWRLG